MSGSGEWVVRVEHAIGGIAAREPEITRDIADCGIGANHADRLRTHIDRQEDPADADVAAARSSTVGEAARRTFVERLRIEVVQHDVRVGIAEPLGNANRAALAADPRVVHLVIVEQIFVADGRRPRGTGVSDVVEIINRKVGDRI